MSSEKDGLLSKTIQNGDEKYTEPRGAISGTWRHGLILPAMFLLMTGSQMYSYVLNEWTQFRMKEVYLSNDTMASNFSQCSNTNSSSLQYKSYRNVQQHSANWLIMYNLAEQIPQIVVNLVLPGYTDVYGRKFYIVLCFLGCCIKAVMISVSVYYECTLLVIVAANALYGVSGGAFGMFSVVFSFIADLTHDENLRIVGIVCTECVLILTAMIGPYLSGYFIESIELGFLKTSVIGSSFCIAAFLMALIIPESLSNTNRHKPMTILQNVKRITDFYVSKQFKGQRLLYILLLMAFFVATLAAVNRSSLETLYFLGQPFCWGPSKIGLYMMERHAAQGIVGIISIKILQSCLSNPSIAILSNVSLAGSYILEGFAKTTLYIHLVPVIGMFSFLMIPMLRGMMSAITPMDKQGAMFASAALVEILSNLASSFYTNEVYSLTLTFMSGFVFLCMAFFSVVDIILLLIYKCVKPKEIIKAVKIVRMVSLLDINLPVMISYKCTSIHINKSCH